MFYDCLSRFLVLIGVDIMIPALFVANYIIEYADKKGYEISNLKLQKILYYVNARNLVEHSEPIFSDTMEKWKYGPVIPKVYHEFKEYGAFPLKKENVRPQVITLANGSDDFQIKIRDYDRDEVPYKDIIENTVDNLQAYDSFDLVDKTHEDKLWQDDSERIMNGEKEIKYDNEELREYFNKNVTARIWIIQ